MAAALLRPVLVGAGLVAEGEDRRLDAVLQAEFGEDAADVGLDGLLADRQVPGDLPVAVAAGDQPEHVAGVSSPGPGTFGARLHLIDASY